MSELFPCVDIGNMHFHSREIDAFNGIMQSNTRMGISGRVDHDAVHLLIGAVSDPVHKIPFVVALPEFQELINDGSEGDDFAEEPEESKKPASKRPTPPVQEEEPEEPALESGDDDDEDVPF